MDDSKKKWLIIIGLVSYVIISFSYYTIRFGSKGFAYMMGKMQTNLMWLAGIGIAGALLYFFFIYERKIDANFEVYNQILRETTLVRPTNLGYLFISGDKDHQSVKLGKIIGLSIRSNYDSKGNNSETIFKVRITPEGWIRWIMSLFGKPVMIRCQSNLHDTLQGDVYMKCTGVVKHGFYYYPNVVHLNSDAIDKTLYFEAERYIQLDFISKVSPLIARGIGLTARDMEQFKSKTGMDIYNDAKARAGRSNIGG